MNCKKCYWLAVIVLSGCNGFSAKELPGEYFLNAKTTSIESHNGLNRWTIYPVVTNYSFDDDYIIAEQTPSRDKFNFELNYSMYYRYLAYREFLQNPKILDSDSYINFRKADIRGDSANYKLYTTYGALYKSESEIHDLGLIMADSLIKYDPYYRKIFSLKKCYWIIGLSPNQLFGPFSYDEYLAIKNKLQVSQKLKFDFE